MPLLSKNKNECTMINYHQFLKKCVISNACYIMRLLQIRLTSKVTLLQHIFQISYAHKYTAKFVHFFKSQSADGKKKLCKCKLTYFHIK